MDLKWPPALRVLYNTFSSLNFNIEIVAPECSVSVGFSQKWAGMQLLPLLFIGGVFGCVGCYVLGLRVWHYLPSRVTRVQGFRPAPNYVFVVDTAIGVSITSMYYLYFGE